MLIDNVPLFKKYCCGTMLLHNTLFRFNTESRKLELLNHSAKLRKYQLFQYLYGLFIILLVGQVTFDKVLSRKEKSGQLSSSDEAWSQATCGFACTVLVKANTDLLVCGLSLQEIVTLINGHFQYFQKHGKSKSFSVVEF